MISRFVDIRADERGRAVLSVLILLLVVASYTVVKTVRNALFLSRFGITELCLIAIGLAVLTGFIVSVYLRRTAGVPRPTLIGLTNLLIAASLVLIWLGLGVPAWTGVLPWVLYIWSSIFGVFTVMQFWLLANDLFDAREAKRLFGLVGAGAIMGGVVGGFVSRSLAATVGTRNLLLIAGAMLVLEAGLVFVVWPLRRLEGPRRPDERHEQRSRGGLQTVRSQPYLRLIAAAVLAATVATTLLGWQFLGVAKAHFVGRTDEMTAFFGTLSAYLSIVSFGIQTLATAWLLRGFGVGVGLLALPAALLLGAGLILGASVVPGLTLLFAAGAARVSEGGVRFAVDRACMELMWMPVPARLKEQGKAFVDTVVDRLGTGCAGVIWLVLALFGLDKPEKIQWVSLAVIAVVIGWLYMIKRARWAYVDAFRDVLALRETDLGRLQVKLVDREAQRMVTATLASEDPREVLFALYMLEDWPVELPDLAGALQHSDPRVVQETLNVLRRREDSRHREAAASCVTHPAEDVRESAIEYLRRTAPDDADPVIEELTRSERVDPATVDVIKLGVPAYAEEATEALRGAIKEAPVERKVRLLRLLGAAPLEAVAQLVGPFLADDARTVVSAAIFAVGRARCVALVPDLVRLLADWRYRRPAGEALRRIGNAAANELALVAQSGAAPGASRQAAVRLLGAVGTSQSSALLMSLARDGEFDLARIALRALNRLHSRGECEVDNEIVAALLATDMDYLYRDLLLLRRGSWADLRTAQRPRDLLDRALTERADDRIERVFLALSLRYDVADVRAAYRGLRSPLKSIRATGIEFLDNVLAGDLKLRLLPLLEIRGPRMFAAVARQQEGLLVEQRPEALRRMLRESDTVLQTVASWTVGAENTQALQGELEQLAGREEPLGAVVRVALARLDAKRWEEPKMGLTAIEKALKLQKVDVLQQASTEDLAHIAQIAEELELEAGRVVYREGDAPDALFVVVSGKVRLHRDDVEIAVLGQGEAFGSWALIDEAPRVASATVAQDATLLRVGRDEFVELLADRVDIVQAVFRAMVARLRTLAGVSSMRGGAQE